MKFIILVSNLKEISPSVFSWKKEYIKNYDAILTVKIRFARKKILNYAYVLKNGVGRYNIFFLFLHKACWILLFVSFSSMFLFVPCAFSSTNNFAHAQTLYRMSSLCRSYECMNIARVNIGVLTGWKKIKQRHISFLLGYLRMILWKFQLQYIFMVF